MITSNGVILKDFAVEDTIGDAIVVKGAKGISFIRVRTEWTGGPKAVSYTHLTLPTNREV